MYDLECGLVPISNQWCYGRNSPIVISHLTQESIPGTRPLGDGLLSMERHTYPQLTAQLA